MIDKQWVFVGVTHNSIWMQHFINNSGTCGFILFGEGQKCSISIAKFVGPEGTGHSWVLEGPKAASGEACGTERV